MPCKVFYMQTFVLFWKQLAYFWISGYKPCKCHEAPSRKGTPDQKLQLLILEWEPHPARKWRNSWHVGARNERLGNGALHMPRALSFIAKWEIVIHSSQQKACDFKVPAHLMKQVKKSSTMNPAENLFVKPPNNSPFVLKLPFGF